MTATTTPTGASAMPTVTITISATDAPCLIEALDRAIEREREYSDPNYGFGADDSTLANHRHAAFAMTSLHNSIASSIRSASSKS